MNHKYEITNQLLNTIYEFSRLHGTLYALDKNKLWLKELKKKEGARAALAAATIDTDLDLSNLDPDPSNLPELIQRNYKSYRLLKEEMKTIFADISTFKVININTLHSRILGLSDETVLSYRKSKKMISHLENENGIYIKREVTINTKPANIPKMMREFAEFIQSEFRIINPIILTGISYFNIVKIHPFDDGNGRLAKLMTHGILHMHGIDSENYLPIEEYFLKNRDRYYIILERSILSNNITEWLEFFAQALLYAVKEAIYDLKLLSSGAIDLDDNRIIDLTDNEISILNLMRKNPNISGSGIARKMKVSRQSINVILQRMSDKGLLNKNKHGSNSKYSLRYSV